MTDTPSRRRPAPFLTGQVGPLLLLLLVLGAAWLALLARGLDLGFTGDLLDYAYHYERFGTFGGMQWLVTEHLHRHLFAGLFSAPIAYLFPNQSAVWYAYAFAAHFGAAVVAYLLAAAVLRGRRLWLAFTAALLFAFHTLHTTLNFEFPTSGHGNSAFVLALLSLYLFLQYVRRGRRNRWWLELSLAAYIVAVGTYEQTVLFFLLHPLIAWFEDRAAGVRRSPVAFVRRALADSFWFPVFVVIYLYLLRVLFTSSDLRLSPEWILSQLVNGLRAEVEPGPFFARIAPAWSGGWLPLTLVLALLFAALYGLWSRRQPATTAPTQTGGFGFAYLGVLGLGISLVSIAGVAPTDWGILQHPRMIYPSAVGFGFLLAALSATLVWRAPVLRWPVALLLGLLIASGAVRYYTVQSDYQAQAAARQRVIDAVTAVVPDVTGDPPPYLLIYSDAHPQDLWLFAQDYRFPYTFDRIYGVVGMPVDVLYFDLDPALAPPDDQPGSEAHGQYLVVEPEGIYSPLQHGVPIDPSRLIVVYYDSATGTAQVMDRLPDDVRERANIVARADIDWRSNRALIVEPTP